MSLALFVSAYTGTTNDRLKQLLLANGATGGTIDDMWMQFLGSLGHTGSKLDRMRKFLLSYTGAADTGQTIEDLWSLVTAPYSGGILLDLYGTGAEAAYSTRKLRSGVTFAMKIVETGGGTEQNIGFEGNDLDTAEVLGWVGVTDGRVRTWYDQSTGGEDLTQDAFPTRRAFIATAGAMETAPNGKPILRGLDTTFYTIPNGLTNSVKSAFFMFKTDNTAAAFDWALALNTGGTIQAVAGGAAYTGPGYTNVSTVQSVGENTSAHILSIVLAGTTATVHLDNVSLGTIAGLSDLGPLEFIFSNYPGRIGEVVLYSTDKTSNRADITANMAAYWGVVI